MGLVLPTIDADHVQPRPMVQASADQIGLVEVRTQVGPTEMALDPGTIGLGMLLDTWRGRSPLYRLEEFWAQHETALLWGKAGAPEAFQADTVGRGLDRLSDTGTRQVCTAGAGQAARGFGCDKRDVHFDTTSSTVDGDARPPEEAEEQAVPLRLTQGPTAGPLAHSARDLRTVSKAQPGTEPNYGVLKAPGMVHRLFLKKPDRLEALGRV